MFFNFFTDFKVFLFIKNLKIKNEKSVDLSIQKKIYINLITKF